MKLYGDITPFIEWLKKGPIVVGESNSEWEVIRYYHTDDEAFTSGAPEWGMIYKNKKGRITLVGAAINDYLEFKNV